MKISPVRSKAYCTTTSKIKLLFFPGQVIAGAWMREDVMSWILWSHAQQNFPNVSWFFFLNICHYVVLQILIVIENSSMVCRKQGLLLTTARKEKEILCLFC